MTMFKKMFKKFLGFEEEEYALDNQYEEFEEEEENVYNEDNYLNSKVEYKKQEEITLYPKTFADASEIVEHLAAGNIVTINMDDVDIDICKRITDFVLGAIYVLDGDVEKISKKCFRFWTNK